MKLDMLAFGAHPDDVELCCSGTLMKHIDLGYNVGIVDLTRGELGTRGNAELRKEEAKKATSIMNVPVRENLEMADGFFQNDRDHQMDVIQVIRRYRPEIILTNAIKDRHPDHGRASKLVSVSAYLSGLNKIETDDDNEPQEAWRPKAIYHYVQDRYLHVDLAVDITGYIDRKMEAIKAYSSQFYNPDSDEPETPISSKSFLDYMIARSREYGRQIGVEYAEGYITERHIGVDDLISLK